MANEKTIMISIMVVLFIIIGLTLMNNNNSSSSSNSDLHQQQKQQQVTDSLEDELKTVEDKIQRLEVTNKQEIDQLKETIELLTDNIKDLHKSILKTESSFQHHLASGDKTSSTSSSSTSSTSSSSNVPSLEEERANMKAQFGEDKYVYENFFKNPLKRNGFFLEVGALDGVTFSNTYFYEKVLGWDGILIEATPKTAEKMMKVRKNTFKFNGGVCDEKKMIKIISAGTDAVNGNPDNMSDEFKSKFYKDKNIREYEVECNTLTHYIRASGRTYLDIMVVDIEGGEYDAFRGFDFDTITVGVLIVEITQPELEKNKLLKQMLMDHGYEFNKKIDLSEIWINKKIYS